MIHAREAGQKASLPTAYLATLAFVAGLHVMLLEMCAFRVLQTTFGSSIYVTGVLLTLIMLALAGGYYLGGVRAHRHGIEDLLRRLLGAALWVALACIVAREPILDWGFGLRQHFHDRLWLNVVPVSVVTLVLFALPMMALGQTTPFLVACLSRNGATEAGLIAGRLMALSTVGSILGTAGASFWLIPTFGVDGTLVTLLVSLVVLLGGGLLASRRMLLVGASVTLLLLGAASPRLAAKSAASGSIIFERESRYGTITVREREDLGRRSYLYEPNRLYLHSNHFPDSPLDAQFPLGYVALSAVLGHHDYLVLGVAGGTVLTQLSILDPRGRITGVEIDEVSIQVAREYFDVPKGVRLVEDDARMFLTRDPQRHDVIVVDLFAGQFIPAHCVTTEFFTLVREHLVPGGMAVINANMKEVWAAEPELAEFPAQHVHAALFQAGFASLFQDDALGEGFIYAFTTETSEAALLERLRASVADESLDPHLRASLAGSVLRLVQVPQDRARLKAFTDRWTPEPLLQAGTSSRARVAAALKERTAARGPLAWAYLDLEGSADSGPGHRAAQDAYCAVLLQTAGEENPRRREELAMHFLEGCPEDSVNPALMAMSEGLNLLGTDRGLEALGPLRVAIEGLR